VVFARRECVYQMVGRGLRIGGWVWERGSGGWVSVVERAALENVRAWCTQTWGGHSVCSLTVARCARLAGGTCTRIHRGSMLGASVCIAVA